MLIKTSTTMTLVIRDITITSQIRKKTKEKKYSSAATQSTLIYRIRWEELFSFTNQHNTLDLFPETHRRMYRLFHSNQYYVGIFFDVYANKSYVVFSNCRRFFLMIVWDSNTSHLKKFLLLFFCEIHSHRDYFIAIATSYKAGGFFCRLW